MRIGIYGIGAVGGLFASLLARGGHTLALIARGEHLAAIRRDGLRLATPDGELLTRPELATDDPAEVGPVDALLVAVKTWQLPQILPSLPSLVGPGTVVLPLQNGVEAAAEIAAAVGPSHVLGGLCGTVTFLTGPGQLSTLSRRHRVELGELDGSRSERVEQLHQAFLAAGLASRVPDDIHAALWEKLLFVASFGGVGALARAPAAVLRSVPSSRALLSRAMAEVAAVAAARGVALPPGAVERGMAVVDQLPPEGTASLQRDLTAGRRSELDAWSGAVVRLGHEAAVPTPIHATIYAAMLPTELAARDTSTT
jgi:2-dehydropantoate 2-reductase